MKSILFLIIFIFLQNCSKQKIVFICGNHNCINKAEAKQYFEENLSLEVKVLNNKDINEVDLVELNLRNNNEKDKKISIKQKEKTSNEVNILTNDEIKKIKKKILEKKRNKKLVKRKNKKKQKNKKIVKKITNDEKKNERNLSKSKKISVNMDKHKTNINVAVVCTIIKKCSIDEISKYLLNQGKKKKFPNITSRE